jgi:putative Mn2+ efflux pump MntP
VRFRRFAVAAILAICIGAPIVEMFDQWDHTLQDGNDTEANVAVAALCIGVAMAIGTIVVVARLRALASNSRRYIATPRVVSFVVALLASPIPTTSPPTPLRV